MRVLYVSCVCRWCAHAFLLILINAVLSKCRDKLVAFLEAEEAAGRTVYPAAADLFSFMRMCPLERVQVVIVGQDPYHGPGQAHGACVLCMFVRVWKYRT